MTVAFSCWKLVSKIFEDSLEVFSKAAKNINFTNTAPSLRAVVVKEYEAKEEGYISLLPFQVVLIHSEKESDPLLGTILGSEKKGFFPKEFVEFMIPEIKSGPEEEDWEVILTKSVDVTFKAGEVLIDEKMERQYASDTGIPLFNKKNQQKEKKKGKERSKTFSSKQKYFTLRSKTNESETLDGDNISFLPGSDDVKNLNRSETAKAKETENFEQKLLVEKSLIEDVLNDVLNDKKDSAVLKLTSILSKSPMMRSIKTPEVLAKSPEFPSQDPPNNFPTSPTFSNSGEQLCTSPECIGEKIENNQNAWDIGTVYFIRKGIAQVSKLNEFGTEVNLLKLGKNELIGIPEFILNTFPSMKVTAVTDLEVTAFDGNQSCRVFENKPQLGFKFFYFCCLLLNEMRKMTFKN